jgi:hypothetical protein
MGNWALDGEFLELPGSIVQLQDCHFVEIGDGPHHLRPTLAPHLAQLYEA